MDSPLQASNIANTAAAPAAVAVALEHILLRPDTYIGSVEKHTQSLWVSEGDEVVHRPVAYVPGLYKIFDQMLVNAANNKQQEPAAPRSNPTHAHLLQSSSKSLLPLSPRRLLRVALINYGKECGKLVMIVDVVNKNRGSLSSPNQPVPDSGLSTLSPSSCGSECSSPAATSTRRSRFPLSSFSSTPTMSSKAPPLPRRSTQSVSLHNKKDTKILGFSMWSFRQVLLHVEFVPAK
ncbi:hypothetical protein NL676_024249 [Syzygium grande]|nr:hypothetical protein NL676_024249 [Syzygium grande]